MAIGKKKHIFPNAIHRKSGISFHHLKIKCSNKIGTSQRSTGVSALNTMYHSNDIPSNLGSNFFEFLNCHLSRLWMQI